VFADPVATDLHLSHEWLFAIFSGALLLSGLLGPLAGRMIDGRGGREVLAGTNLVFAAGLALLATAHGVGGLAFTWMVLGIGMGFGLYEASFATVAGLYGAMPAMRCPGSPCLPDLPALSGGPASAYFIGAFGPRRLSCVGSAALHARPTVELADGATGTAR